MAGGGSTFGFCPTDTLALICVKANSMKLIASLKYLNMYARCQNGPHLSLPPKSASCMRWRRCSGPRPLSLHAALSATMLPPRSLVMVSLPIYWVRRASIHGMLKKRKALCFAISSCRDESAEYRVKY